MEGLFKNHFFGHCYNAAFEKSGKIASKPWNSDDGPTVNVQLELERKALDVLEDSERIYVEWFSFRWYPLTPTYACFRCFSFDHKVAKCRMKEQISIVSDSASTWATYDWSVSELDLSDHNIITVVTLDQASTVESFAPVPSWQLQNADWRRFSDELRTASMDIPLEDFHLLSLDAQVAALRSLVHQVSDALFGRRQPRARRRVGWWNAAFADARRTLRRARRRLQHARRSHSESVSALASYFRITRKEYERLMLKAKEEDRRRAPGRPMGICLPDLLWPQDAHRFRLPSQERPAVRSLARLRECPTPQ
ncbi:hypothetical protein AWZ03_015159, partial [Drosophila navojoa]